MARASLLGMLCLVVEVGAKKVLRCGTGVSLCGVLALESGFGPKAYEHADPMVHGLWPQVSPYGTSKCVAPKDKTVTRKKHGCFKQAGKRQAWFENHEWTKHGICAGARSADDFFDQVCTLSKKPLAAMNQVRDEKIMPCVRQKTEPEQETCFLKIIREMKKSFPVFSIDQYNDQIMLSACAGSNGVWKLAKVADFPRVCGRGRTPHPSSPSRPVSSTGKVPKKTCGGTAGGAPCHFPFTWRGIRYTTCTTIEWNQPWCLAGARGKWGNCDCSAGSSTAVGISPVVCSHMKAEPKCRSNSYCIGLNGRLRCAKSRKCTDIPLLKLAEEPANGSSALLLPGASTFKHAEAALVGWHPSLLLAYAVSLVGVSLAALKVLAQSRSRLLAREAVFEQDLLSVE